MSSSTKSEDNGVQTRTTAELEPPLIQGVELIRQGEPRHVLTTWWLLANGGPIEWGNTLIQSKLVPVVYGISFVTTSMELYLPQWATMRLVDLSLMVNKLSGPFPRVLSRITTLERSNGLMPCWCRSTWGTYSRLKLTAPFARCKMAGFTGVSGIMIRETAETSIAMFICFQRSSIAIISHLSL
ncbi:unnamed protein product [Lactuca saligna]|uniref:Uncharacterized protein n=1 Tax=Lactuca saligna TaxID=75948 RepID=A0AA36E7Y7_LACSI|nr:unnamed protein product [Lactuca saligna]